MSSVDPAQGSVVGEDTTEAARKSVIPHGNVVILREAELDTDLATAIQRVRAKADTRNSRILIIASEQPAAGHEAPKGTSLPVPDMPTSVLQVARAGGEQTLTEFANTYRPLLQSVERFFQETGWVLDEIEEAGEEGVRARLKSRVQVARDILSWIQCALDDMEVPA